MGKRVAYHLALRHWFNVSKAINFQLLNILVSACLVIEFYTNIISLFVTFYFLYHIIILLGLKEKEILKKILGRLDLNCESKRCSKRLLYSVLYSLW